MDQTKRRAPSTAFKPGQSGNPGGRPAVVKEVQDLAREHTKEALSALVEILNDKAAPAAARVSAASAILDRGYGKPQQTIDANINKPHEDWLDELAQRGALGQVDGSESRH